MQSCLGPVLSKLLPTKRKRSSKVKGKRSPLTVMVKLVVLGSCGVGKTNIIRRYVHNEFLVDHQPTTEDMYEKYFSIKSKNESVLFNIYDTGGSDQFPAMKRLVISQGQAFVVVYAINNRASFEAAKKICAEVFEVKAGQVKSIMMVGNKCDLPSSQQTVSTEEAALTAKQMKCKFTESSAKLGINIEKIFRESLID